MKFLNNLFKLNNNNTNTNEKLIDCVNKIDKSDGGVFANIMNDLGSYINIVGENDDSLRIMAYAYARRMAAAGLCAQGTWGQEEFDYTYNLFKSFQLSTGQTIEFQEEASAQAIELIKSYDHRLTKELQMGITSAMMQDASRGKKHGVFLSVDELVGMFKALEK